jgi:ribosomal protein S18 acetylase RimI-like enzyme
METRPPSREHAQSVATLVTAATSNWLGWPETTAAALLRLWDSAGVDVELDARIALEADELVGYALLLPRARAQSTLWAELWTAVNTDGAVVADALLTALSPRAATLARAAPPSAAVCLRLQVEDGRRGLREILERRGFQVVRSPLRMVADLGSSQPTPNWPDGIVVRTFVPADARAVHAFEMETLGDTWQFEPEPFETWIGETEDASFDPSLWWLAEHEGKLVGVMLCRTDADDPELGWLHMIGVSRAWRGRSLGRALVLHAMRELRARGFSRAGLGVDADNPTGARRLAERSGFRVAQRFWTYEQHLRSPQPLRRLLRRARRLTAVRASRRAEAR